MAERIKTYSEFWPYYMGEHAHPLCRRLHFIGTSLVFGILITAIVTGRWGMLAFMPIAGYGFAWLGHFGVEKNRPATFTYPFWSLGSDFVMFYKMLTFQMDAELAKLGITWPRATDRQPQQA